MNRDYKFVEFFAGMGGFSRAVGELASNCSVGWL